MEESFFERKKQNDHVKIPDPGPYDMKNPDDIESCGLEKESFLKRNKALFDKQDLTQMEGNNPVAFLSHRIEQCFSTREIAFLLAKESIGKYINIKNLDKKNGK
jgi:hypothetical protein